MKPNVSITILLACCFWIICKAIQSDSRNKQLKIPQGKKYVNDKGLISKDLRSKNAHNAVRETRFLKTNPEKQNQESQEDYDGTNIVLDSVPSIHAKIINGITTEFGRYQYMVSLTDQNGNHLCGGSLITGNLVLTAAHCRGAVSTVEIGRYNNTNKWENYEVFKIDGEVVHPDYDPTYVLNDFMVIKLSGKSNYPRIALAKKGQNIPNDLTVFGWGVTDEYGFPYRGPLLGTNVKYIPNHRCENSVGFFKGYYVSYKGLVKENMMCAGFTNADSCFGDSGGPLIIKGTTSDDDIQVGIVSWGFGCNHPDFPGVYARIDYQIDWIERVIRILSPDDVPSNVIVGERPDRKPSIPQSCTKKRGCDEGFNYLRQLLFYVYFCLSVSIFLFQDNDIWCFCSCQN